MRGTEPRSLEVGVSRALLLACLAVAACGDHAERRVEGKATRGHAAVGGRILSTIDGHAIAIGQVQSLVADGLTPRVALERLQAELLLSSEAERRGYETDPEVLHVGRQAMVQALLARSVESYKATEAEVQAWYEAGGERWNRPERRAAVHVLASVGQEPSAEADRAARAFAARVIEEMRAARDPAAVIERYKDSKQPLFRVVAERVPPIAESASYDEAYKRAIFSHREPGVHPEPVRSQFGWHAIALTQIIPALHIPLEEVRETVVTEVEIDKRRKRLVALEQDLRGAYGVEIPKRVGEALASFEL